MSLFRNLLNGAFYCMQRYNASNPYWQFTNGGSTTSYNTIVPITEHHVMKWKDNKIYADDVLLTEFTKDLNTSNRMLLYSGDGVNRYPNMIYFCKLWEPNSGLLVRDFIPVLDWDMKPCMYDKISGKLFYNQNTSGDDFSYGREIHYVDYLESTGTQYIDTGVKLTNNYSVELDYQLTQASQSRAGLFGALNMTGSNQGRIGSILSPSNSQLEHGYGSGNDYWQQGMPDTNRHKLYQKKNETYFDGSLVHTFNTATFSLAINAYLGNFVYTNYTPAKAKYYSSKWWDGDILVRDYLPAIDENGVGFMFDKVTHTIYDNAGTDAFIYPARGTEYIEVTDVGTSNQSPCIDLGLKYKPSMSIEAKYTRTAQGLSGSVLPLSNTTTQPLIYMPALNANSKIDRFVWRRSGFAESSYYYDFADYPMTVEFKVDAVNDALIVNNNIVKTGMITAMNGYESPYESYSNLYMLSINGTYGGMGKVYYLKLYDTTQVYRDLIPVWKDGVACMYDKQNNVYYSNTKTGTVVCGKIIESKWF